MNNKILSFLFFIIFGFTFIIFYKSLEDSSIYTPDTSLEKEIPIFNTKNFFSRENIKSSDIFKLDKIYLLNIWSSWCAPCKFEHKFLIQLNKEQNLEIVGLNYKDNVKNAKNYLEELSNPYDILISDKNGLTAIEWGAYGVPETFLIYDKKILKKIIGPITNDSMNEIKELIKT